MEHFSEPFIPDDKQQQEAYRQMMNEALAEPIQSPEQQTSPEASHNAWMTKAENSLKMLFTNIGGGVLSFEALKQIGYDPNLFKITLAFGVANTARTVVRNKRAS